MSSKQMVDINSFGHGVFLSPQTRPTTRLTPSLAIQHKAITGGLIYAADESIVTQSIDPRFSTIPLDKSLQIEDEQSGALYLFLGYYFRHYGHFIFETLPMLSYCLDERFKDLKKIFLPYFLNSNNIEHNIDKPSNLNLIYSFLDLLSIDSNKIIFHTKNSILKANFLVPPKIVNGKKPNIDPSFHSSVIQQIKNKFDSVKPHKKVFIIRKPDKIRITASVTSVVENFCKNVGFELINMSNLTIEQQLRLMHETKTLIGFSGSGMHNAMFLQPEATAITMCDLRDFKSPHCCIPNQQLCNRISQCKEIFIDFKCQEHMIKSLFKNNILTEEQEQYAASAFTNRLSQIL